MAAAVVGVADLTALGQNKCLYLQQSVCPEQVFACMSVCRCALGVHMQVLTYCN